MKSYTYAAHDSVLLKFNKKGENIKTKKKKEMRKSETEVGLSGFMVYSPA